MWNRELMKTNAKNILRFNYWKAFLVSLVVGILGGGGGGGGFSYSSSGNYGGRYDDFLYHFDPAILLFILMVGFFASLVGLAFYIFLGGPMQVSSAKYYVAQREQPGDLNHLFFGFKGGKYLNYVKAMSWSLLFTFLWSLLFIIPGIIKGYSYRMIPYIMSENPDMDYRQAMKLSMAMTNGMKADMFVMDLSFIGWFLLGALLCGIGILFVVPYYAATIAETYIFIRERAISLGICPRETFYPGFGQSPFNPYTQPPYQPPMQ